MSGHTNLELIGKLWIELNGIKVIGPGRVELLERIIKCGSIRQAAMQMEMPYRQAWQLIEHMNTSLDAPVVISHRGGKDGGNAEVTEKGQQVIAQFNTFYGKFQQFLAENNAVIKQLP
ncbi:MAG TPA: ModE family transcriptional regulator [Pedobacter sp.]|jgi:molybdate transport system regulatory protein